METQTVQPGPDANSIVVPNAQVTSQTKTAFGFGAFTAPTPKEATYAFVAYFIISKAVLSWISTTTLISPENINELKNLLIYLLDPIALGFSQMFGIKVEQ